MGTFAVQRSHMGSRKWSWRWPVNEAMLVYLSWLLCFSQYTFDDLLEHVQASESEIWEALHKLQSCMVDGKIPCSITVVSIS